MVPPPPRTSNFLAMLQFMLCGTIGFVANQVMCRVVHVLHFILLGVLFVAVSLLGAKPSNPNHVWVPSNCPKDPRVPCELRHK